MLCALGLNAALGDACRIAEVCALETLSPVLRIQSHEGHGVAAAESFADQVGIQPAGRKVEEGKCAPQKKRDEMEENTPYVVQVICCTHLIGPRSSEAWDICFTHSTAHDKMWLTVGLVPTMLGSKEDNCESFPILFARRFRSPARCFAESRFFHFCVTTFFVTSSVDTARCSAGRVCPLPVLRTA